MSKEISVDIRVNVQDPEFPLKGAMDHICEGQVYSWYVEDRGPWCKYTNTREWSVLFQCTKDTITLGRAVVLLTKLERLYRDKDLPLYDITLTYYEIPEDR